MCVCCVCVCVLCVCMRAHTHTHTHSHTQICMYTHACACTWHACVYMHTYVCVCVCMHLCVIYCNVLFLDKPLSSSEAGTLYNPASTKLVETEKQVSNSPKQLSSIEKLSVSIMQH